jgi:hypothetical protein
VKRLTLALAALALFAGCASSHHGSGWNPAIQPAIDVPTHFLILGRGNKTEEPAPGQCRSPMIDPRDGTRIVLVRSMEGRAYYRVPAGRYGVRPGELLLVECGTGRVIGVVKP